MRQLRRVIPVFLVSAGMCGAADAQGPTSDPARKWEIVDNSFLVEESFNQEAGVFQNIFTWTRARDGVWEASFTQEWPAPDLRHQFSYTIPFSSMGGVTGVDDVLVNYRYQLLVEGARQPAVSPRISVIVPTGIDRDAAASHALGLQVNVPASKQFGNLYVHANGGFTWLPDVDGTPHAAAGGIWRVTSMFHLLMEAVVEIGDAVTLSPGFRRGWNFGRHQLVFGAAAPVTTADGRSTAALLTYLSYELPFR